MKSMNWISGTGRRPYSAMPIDVPMMPPSASGVSNTRSGNSSINPSVQRKTPPFRPTSSPRITTRSSRRISSRSALLIAWTIVIAGISRPRRVVLLVRIFAHLAAREASEHLRVVLERQQIRVLVEPVLVVRLEFHGPDEVVDDLGLVAQSRGDPRQVEMGARSRRLEFQRPRERVRGALQVPCMEQVVPEAVPGPRIVRLRVGQHPIDPRGLEVVAFRAEARRGEGADVSIEVPFPLQERQQDREGFLRAPLLEQLVGPLHAGR